MEKLEPIIGEWYQMPEGTTFEVVALDQEEGTVEIQYFDGAIEEFDLPSWEQIPLQIVEQSEDWSGSVDIMHEDFMTDISALTQEDWSNPLDEIDSDALEIGYY